MIGSVTSNSLIAAVFGPGPLSGPYGPVRHEAVDAVDRASTDAHTQPVDTVEFSNAGYQRAEADKSTSTNPLNESDVPSNGETDKTEEAGATGALSGDESLTADEEKEVRELEQRDREVRRHEAAHTAAAGPHANGGAQFEFTTGPDGKRYATGGEVNIDTSEVSDNPRATIAKMQQIRRAALAPANPSAQDRAVASRAAATEREARAALAKPGQTDGSDEADRVDPTVPATDGNTPRPEVITPSSVFAATLTQAAIRPAGSLLDLTI